MLTTIKKKKSKALAARFIENLKQVLVKMPKGNTFGYIKYEILDKNEGFIVDISPSTFMALVDANSNMRVEKERFWDDACQTYIVTYTYNEVILRTTLNKTQPRDAAYLDSRR